MIKQLIWHNYTATQGPNAHNTQTDMYCKYAENLPLFFNFFIFNSYTRKLQDQVSTLLIKKIKIDFILAEVTYSQNSYLYENRMSTSITDWSILYFNRLGQRVSRRGHICWARL